MFGFGWVCAVSPFCRMLVTGQYPSVLGGPFCSPCHIVSSSASSKLKPAIESFPVMGHEPHTAMMPMFILVFGFR